MVTIPDLPAQSAVNVSDDDLYVTYDMGGGATPARKVTRADMLKDVVRTSGTFPVGTLNATGSLNAPSGAIDAMTCTTGITIGAQLQKVFAATASLAVATLTAGASVDVTLTVTGAATGDLAIVNALAALPAGLTLRAWVSAANTVTISITNASTASITGASYSFRAAAIRIA